MKIDIKLDDTPLKQVKEFCYLGSTITYKNERESEIKRRIALAKQAFQNKKSLLVNNHKNVEIRKGFAKAFVTSVVTYGCETLGKKERKKLEARKNVIISFLELWGYVRPHQSNCLCKM